MDENNLKMNNLVKDLKEVKDHSNKLLLNNKNTLTLSNGLTLNDEKCKEDKKLSKKTLITLNSSIALLSISIAVLFWFTNFYGFILSRRTILNENSDMFEWWKNSAVDPIMKVYVFNYTNIDRFISGLDKKLKVKECGPYAYSAKMQKVIISIDDDRITYRENRSHKFLPSLSGDFTEHDVLIVPNTGLISAFSNVKKLGVLAEFGFNGILTFTNPDEFQELSIKKIFFGNKDDEFLKTISKIQWNFKPEDAGILSSREGLSKNTITVNSGTKFSNMTEQVILMDNHESFHMWKSESCNKVSGGGGRIYSADLIRNKQKVHIYMPEFYKSIPMSFKEEKYHKGIPSYTYAPSPYGFHSPKPNKPNEEYCELKSMNEEHIDGTLAVSDCIYGYPPIYLSVPHFLKGDARLFEHIEGLSPNDSLHLSHTKIHPKLAVPIYGISRLQFNIKVSHFKKYYEKLPKDLILPLSWVEMSVEELPIKFVFLLHLVEIIEIILKYGSLCCLCVTIFNLIRLKGRREIN